MCKKYGTPLSRTAHRATKNQEKNEKERKGKKKTKGKKKQYIAVERVTGVLAYKQIRQQGREFKKDWKGAELEIQTINETFLTLLTN